MEEPTAHGQLPNETGAREARLSSGTATIVIGCGVPLVAVAVIVGLAVSGLRGEPIYWAVLVTTVVVLGLVALHGGHFFRFLENALCVVLMVAIGAGIPTVTIMLFSGGESIISSLDSENSLPHATLARWLQLVFVVVASLLPALFFFMYERQRVKRLREEFYHHIVMLDQNLNDKDHAKREHGERVDDFYGIEGNQSERLLLGTRYPALLATALITVGWTLTLPLADELPADKASETIIQALTPHAFPLAFGFLGAYVAGLSTLFRRYLRADLQPKAYIHTTVDILTAIAFVWALSALIPTQAAAAAGFSGPTLMLGVSFTIGLIPGAGVTFLRQWWRSVHWRPWANRNDALSELREEHPLQLIEGINVYHRMRLLEEGIENVEDLAHHDLPDLILRTRVPVPVLLDWVDQAILAVHTWSTDDKATPARQILRAHGIRAATDLIRARERAAARGGHRERALLGLLGGEPAGVLRLEVIMDTLSDDEWLSQLLHWRSHQLSGPRRKHVSAFSRISRAATRCRGRRCRGEPKYPA